MGEYFLTSNWIHLDKTITKEYDQNGQNLQVVTETYEYNNINHLNPTRTEITNTKGETIRTDYKYPIDFTSVSSVYNSMIRWNIISPVIEQVQTNVTLNKDPKTGFLITVWLWPALSELHYKTRHYTKIIEWQRL